MTKQARQIILLLWIGTTSLLDFAIAGFAFSLIACLNCATYGIADGESTVPIYTIVINQVSISLLMLLVGIVWSGLVLLATERLLVFLKFPTPGNRKFSKLSLGLLKFSLIVTVLALILGNIYLIYTRIQGESI
ncbi:MULTISPECIES: hypothetical protein [unclassified Chamaesiphon]|uniref:hypothetical protein n=1 Tax=unclassified Chamaesiphon TaxID=2620921 RepID=UPI00286C1334|nr:MULTISPECIES: hypothetical protein [unclassified Chamaesiphon]